MYQCPLFSGSREKCLILSSRESAWLCLQPLWTNPMVANSVSEGETGDAASVSDLSRGACSVPYKAWSRCIGYSNHLLDLVLFFWCESVCWVKNLVTSEKRVNIKEIGRIP